MSPNSNIAITHTTMPQVAPTQPTFDSNFKVNWYRTPIDRDLLRELSQRNNFRAWVQTLLHLGFFFATAILAYCVFLTISATNWYWSIPLLLITLFVHGTIGPFMGLIAVHELQHRTVFKSKNLNVFFEVLYSFLSWSDHIWYRESHAIHHQATCQSSNDGEVRLPIKITFRRWRVWLGLLAWNPLTTWQRLVTVWRHANGEVRGDWYKHVLPESNRKLRTKHRNWARILLLGHSLLAILFIVSGHAFLIVTITFGTFYCGWLGFLCGVPQHYGLNSNEPDFRMNTRTFTCSWLPAFYYWNMQYHLEHHMYPAVPFYNLPKLRKAIEHDLPPATHGLYSTWKDLINLKRKFRTDPNYKYIPAIPNVRAVESNKILNVQ